MHGGRNVCSKGEEGPRNSGRFWDGSSKGHEEGDREEHVIAEALEINELNSHWACGECLQDSLMLVGNHACAFIHRVNGPVFKTS